MSRRYLDEVLKNWQKHAEFHHDLCEFTIQIPRKDLIRVEALAKLYHLDQSHIITDLLSQSLNEIEESIPYKQGKKVIRIEEGDPIFEDIGLMPTYLKYKQQLERHTFS